MNEIIIPTFDLVDKELNKKLKEAYKLGYEHGRKNERWLRGQGTNKVNGLLNKMHENRIESSYGSSGGGGHD